ncbi:MAG: amidohydrolase family protein, partial [Deltaproteobacteria bacterium]|nr:amidohydrolase family protein [Deltaproteobacteria bacterium]
MIIDAHTHIFPAFFREKREMFFDKEPAFKMLYSPSTSKMQGASNIRETMEAEGVDKSIVFGFPWKTKDYYKRHNDYIIESVMLYPDRLAGLACFDPVSPEGAKEAERCFKAGLKGVGELAVYDSPLTEDVISRMADVMTVCLEHDAPLLIHTNEPVGHKYPGKQEITLKQVENFIKAYQNNKIILAHWGGGIFFYSLLKKEIREILKNVWVDTAASPYLYDPAIYKTAGSIMGYEKILFGSDYPLIKPGRYFRELESSGIAPDDIEKIKGK